MERQPQNVKTVIVSNNREYYSPLDSIVPKDLRQEFIRSDIDESDMNLMWHGDNKLVIVPEPIDPAFVSDINSIFEYKNTHLYVPESKEHGITEATKEDPNAMRIIKDAIAGTPEPQIIGWGYTPGFQSLVTSLREAGTHVLSPENPLDHALWTPDYVDTKIGSREVFMRVAQKDNRFLFPEGFVCADAKEVLNVSEYFTGRGKGVVLKANLGGAGAGVNVLKPSEFGRSADDNRQRIQKVIDQNPMMQDGPVIIEEYVKPDFRHPGTFPSVDSIIRPDGSVALQSVDAMVIKHHEGMVDFYGCVLGKELFSKEQHKLLSDLSLKVGEELSSLGYRGWFDTDYILTEDGKFYATEVNLRRTSICYMLDLGQKLFGDNFQNEVAMRSNDKFIRSNLKNFSYGDLKEVLAPVMYPMEDKQTGVVITQSFRSMYDRGKFGYVAIGKTQEEAAEIEKTLEDTLEKV